MKKTHHQPIAILGAGSWGTALALHLSRLGRIVRLWTYDKESILLMQKERANTRYLPGFAFPETLQPTVDLDAAVTDVENILIAVPSAAFNEVLTQIKPLIAPATKISWATKGLDAETGRLLHEVAVPILGTTRSYAVLSGPSFAREVAAGLPTAVVAASKDLRFAKDLAACFNSTLFRVYVSSDITGVEVGGVVKNALAIATGIADGMQFGANARSALITRGLAEMMRLGLALGGQTETLIGLAGVGDLVLTCTDNQSRNRRFGMALGQGKKPAEAEREIMQVVEGKRNAELIVQLAEKYQIEMPITAAVWEILRGNLTPVEAMQQLLARTPKTEY